MRIEGDFEYAETVDDLIAWGNIRLGDEAFYAHSWTQQGAIGYPHRLNSGYLHPMSLNPMQFRRRIRQTAEHPHFL